MISKYRVVFFDAGGTLVHPYPSVGEIYAGVARRYGCRNSASEIQSLFTSAWKRRDGIGGLNSQTSEKIERQWWRDLVHEVFSALGGVDNFDGFFEELYDLFARPEVWRLYPGTMEVLKALKKRGQKLAIISNWDSRLLKLCETLGIQDYMEFILASAVVGVSKPDPRIFLEALQRMNSESGDAVHVGDSWEDDVKGATKLGIEAIWINRHGDSHPAASHQQAQRIRTIRDLKELL